VIKWWLKATTKLPTETSFKFKGNSIWSQASSHKKLNLKLAANNL
jgi:hypothetical protein